MSNLFSSIVVVGENTNNGGKLLCKVENIPPCSKEKEKLIYIGKTQKV